MRHHDDAHWHAKKLTTDLPQRAGGTHIGFFLAWALRRQLLVERLQALLPRVESGQITGSALLYDHCGGGLSSEHLNAEGQSFAKYIYADRDFSAKAVSDTLYAKHYRELFSVRPEPDAFCSVADTPENATRVAEMLDGCLRGWRCAATLPDSEQALATLCAALPPVLERAGFRGGRGVGWSVTGHNAGMERRFVGGAHHLQLLSYRDLELGNWGLTLELSSKLDQVVEAALAAHPYPRGLSGADRTHHSLHLFPNS